MSEENTPESVLFDKIAELIADSKGQIKFNTHKNRKAFIEKVVKLALANPEVEGKVEVPTTGNPHKEAVTKLVPDKKSAGFAIMTEAKATLADEVAKNFNARQKAANNW